LWKEVLSSEVDREDVHMGSDLGFESDGDAMVMEDGGLIVQV
jgi:hypothetical protein